MKWKEKLGFISGAKLFFFCSGAVSSTESFLPEIAPVPLLAS